MQVQLKEIGNHPVFAYRKFEILRDGAVVGTLSKGADRRWNAQIVRNTSEPYSDHNRTSYHQSNFGAIQRLIACHLVGEVDRIPYLQRGIWTNPCPVAEIAA